MDLYSDFSKIDFSQYNKYDWFSDMARTVQDAEHHKEGNVQVHTIKVVESIISTKYFNDLNLIDKNILFYAALFHDIEKRSTTKEENGRITANGHARRGEQTARQILYRNPLFTPEQREIICGLIRFHGVPTWAINDEDYIRKIVNTSCYIPNEKLYELAKSDIYGRICNDARALLDNIELFHMEASNLECLSSNYSFKNNISRYKYLNGKGEPNTEFYNDTEFTVHMLCGLAGSGKDHYILNNFADIPMVSLDELRKELKVNIHNQTEHGRMIQEAKERVKINLRKKQDFTFNATNLTKDTRNKWIKIFRDYNAYVKIHYIEVPYKKLLIQNSNRENVVPNESIEKMINCFEMPSLDEAHEIILNFHS